MQLKNLECQLAMAQLKRYKAGAKLSDEALEALESHLVECSDCQMLVQAQAQAQTQAARPEAIPTHAVVESPAPTASQPLNSSEQPSPKSWLKFRLEGNGKTLALSATLAALLIGMSSLANDPTRLFGDRALSPGQKPAEAKVNSTSTPKAPAQPAAAAPTPAVELVAQQAAPENRTPAPPSVQPEPSETPSVASSRPASTTSAPRRTTPRRVTRSTPRRTPTARPTRPAARTVTRQAPRPAAPTTGIRVYDERGNLVR